jgi:hypothetical protein
VDHRYNENVDAGFDNLKSNEWELARNHFIEASNVSRTGEMPNIFVWHLIALSSYHDENEWRSYLEKAVFSAKLYTGVIHCGSESYYKNPTSYQKVKVDPPSDRLSHQRLCVGAYEYSYVNWDIDDVVRKAEFARRVIMVRDCIENDKVCSDLWSD